MTEDVGEFHFCMEKALMDQVGAVFIDYDPTGSFRIYTERPLSIFTTGGGSCSCKTLPPRFPRGGRSRPSARGCFSARRVSAFIIIYLYFSKL
ncbi:MAG: hypothetical protein ACLT2T_01950 [Bilophila wadsworthia]